MLFKRGKAGRRIRPGFSWFAVLLALLTLSAGAGFSPSQAQQVQVLNAPYTMGDLEGKDFYFEVTEDIIIEDLAVEIEMFAYAVNSLDITIWSPANTRRRLLDDNCSLRPISLGRRGYPSPAVGDGSDVTADGSQTATYRFAENGLPDLDDICTVQRPSVSNNQGSWGQLPPTTYATDNSLGTLTDYNGENAKGIWRIRFKEWLNNDTYLANRPNNPLFPGPKIPPIIASIIFDFAPAGTTQDGETKGRVMAQNFMASRASRLLADDLDLEDRLINRGRGTRGTNTFAMANGAIDVDFAVSLINGLADGSDDQVIDVWARGTYHALSNPSGDIDQFNGHLGLDYRVNENAVLGLLASFHHTRQHDGTTGDEISGNGLLVGPYVVARMYQNIIFSSRVQMGFSWNDMSMSSAGISYNSEAFDTKTLLVETELSGDFGHGNWTHSPSIFMKYIEDKTNGGFKLTSGNLSLDIDEIEVSEGRLGVGHTISFVHEWGEYVIIPSIGFSGIWQFDSPDYLDSSGQPASQYDNNTFGRVDGDVTIAKGETMSFDFGMYYEGIGASAQEAFGASADVRVGF